MKHTIGTLHVITKIDQRSTAMEVSNSITILQAICWISELWKNVGSIVVQKCFRRSEILDKDFNVVRKVYS